LDVEEFSIQLKGIENTQAKVRDLGAKSRDKRSDYAGTRVAYAM
jgi:hypothetical protein